MKTSMRFDLVDLRLFRYVVEEISQKEPRGRGWLWHRQANESG
jgi:hypothetical protein